MKIICKEKGFTLIEIIVCMVLIAIVAVGFGSIIVKAVEGYVLLRNSAEVSEKSQLAMARITRELQELTAVATATPATFAYTDSAGVNYQLVKNGSLITLERTTTPVIAAQTLMNDVVNDGTYGAAGAPFLAYTKTDGQPWTVADGLYTLAAVAVVIKVNGFSSVPQFIYQTTVTPRYNTLPISPRMS